MTTTLRKRRLPYSREAARRHLLRADPVMRAIVRGVGPYELAPRGDVYRSLMRALLYQQLAGAAASAIERRYLALYGGRQPEPDELLATSPQRLRSAGISRQKAGYLHSLAQHFADGKLNDRRLRRASDDEVIEHVTQIKGVGRWTADMLLMFCLGRPDVLPVGDLGIQSAMQSAYRLRKRPDAKRMEQIARPWRPYRSAASWYLWRSFEIITPELTL
ncbi:MAG: DNA-3-methyladenine glycosylase 2 family protein [Chloroflexi bacterium]|nr:DNA-3-methyladenine glycosylase 2 family protein [Chloroflexota bacterium]